MKRRWFVLTLLLLAIAVQTEARARSAPLAFQPQAVEEEIEIMRRLIGKRLFALPMLAAQCKSCHDANPASIRVEYLYHSIAVSPTVSQAPAGCPALHSVPLSLEGSFIPDYGIVFHLTLPPVLPDEWRHTSAPPSAISRGGRSDSEWERMRQTLQGQPQVASAPSPDRTIVDHLTSLLAENGKNLTQLADDQHLTIAITVRPGQFGAAAGGNVNRFMVDPTWSPNESLARKKSRLGTLHLRSGRHAEAAKTLGEAMEDGIKAYRADPTTENLQLLREINSSLVVAYEALGQMQEARDVKERLEQVVKTPAPGSQPRAVRMALPFKVTLTVDKRSLMEVAEGKISHEVFQSRVKLSHTFKPAAP